MATRQRKDTDTGYPADPPRDTCSACKHPDPDVRSTHQLSLAKEGGIDLLKPHLYQHFAQTASITTDERREKVEGVCVWVAGLMAMWSGFVSEHTGGQLPWYEARRQRIAGLETSARVAYEQAPDAYKQKYPHDGGSTTPLPGFVKVPRDIATIDFTPTQRRREPDDSEYIQEPGESDDASD